LPEIGSIQALLQKIKHQLLVSLGRDGEAASVHGHALARPRAYPRAWRRNPQLDRLIRAPQPNNFSDFSH
jgi:hypothetical protein